MLSASKKDTLELARGCYLYREQHVLIAWHRTKCISMRCVRGRDTLVLAINLSLT